MGERPLEREFADRMAAAGISEDDPALVALHEWNIRALRRAGVAACRNCPHISVDHHLTTTGRRTHCQVIGAGGVRCGCGEFTPGNPQ